jgi:hypothetical protein
MRVITFVRAIAEQYPGLRPSILPNCSVRLMFVDFGRILQRCRNLGGSF